MSEKSQTELTDLIRAVQGADEFPEDLSMEWLFALSRGDTESALIAGTCLLDRCLDRGYPDAVCEHTHEDYRQEVARLRRVVARIRATDVNHVVKKHRGMCREYGRASQTIGEQRGVIARLREQVADRQFVGRCLRASSANERRYSAELLKLRTIGSQLAAAADTLAEGVAAGSNDVPGLLVTLENAAQAWKSAR